MSTYNKEKSLLPGVARKMSRPLRDSQRHQEMAQAIKSGVHQEEPHLEEDIEEREDDDDEEEESDLASLKIMAMPVPF